VVNPLQKQKEYWENAFIKAFANSNVPLQVVTLEDLTKETTNKETEKE